MDNIPCLQCDFDLECHKGIFKGAVNGHLFEVECNGMICPQCGFMTLNPLQMDDFREKLLEASSA